MPFDVTRLRNWLNSSKLQTTNNPAWQLLSAVIGFIQENSDEIIKLHSVVPPQGSDPNTVLHGAGDPVFRRVETDDILNAAINEDKQILADVTTWDVSIARHGYAPKAPNDATQFLNGIGLYSVPAGGGGGGGVSGSGTAGSVAQWSGAASLTNVTSAGISAALDLLP